MANILKVQEQQVIRKLAARGWSRRRIARELRLDRKTVRRYLSQDREAKSPGVSPPGDVAYEPCSSAAGGRPSMCESLASEIEAKLEKGLTAQRIYQDLVSEVGFSGSYQSVKRFVRQFKATDPNRIWRLGTQPGEEAQVDFGTGAPIVDSDGKRRRPWILRIVLSYSRKAYSEAVPRQTTEYFIRSPTC